MEEALKELGSNELAEMGVQIPLDLITDCVRLCCSLCLLENDPTVIEPDVLSKDRSRFEGSGDQKYVDKAHRRGKVGWNVGRHIEGGPALPATPHGFGVDRPGTGGAQGCATER